MDQANQTRSLEDVCKAWAVVDIRFSEGRTRWPRSILSCSKKPAEVTQRAKKTARHHDLRDYANLVTSITQFCHSATQYQARSMPKPHMLPLRDAANLLIIPSLQEDVLY